MTPRSPRRRERDTTSSPAAKLSPRGATCVGTSSGACTGTACAAPVSGTHTPASAPRHKRLGLNDAFADRGHLYFPKTYIELPETSCDQLKVREVAVVFRSSSERAAS